jgi:hypothetical protein
LIPNAQVRAELHSDEELVLENAKG